MGWDLRGSRETFEPTQVGWESLDFGAIASDVAWAVAYLPVPFISAPRATHGFYVPNAVVDNRRLALSSSRLLSSVNQQTPMLNLLDFSGFDDRPGLGIPIASYRVAVKLLPYAPRGVIQVYAFVA